MLETLSGATRLLPVVGDPIAQVKSPAGVTRMLAERGRDIVCIPCHVAPADFAAFMAGIAAVRNVEGVIVTVPHKFAAFGHCASVTERARFLGAVNVMRRNPDGSFHGDMCDGQGFVAALEEAGCVFSGRRGLLVGAGGAGTAIAHAAALASLSELAIADADPRRRDALVARLSAIGVPVRAGASDPTGYDVIMNATPMGMRPEDPLPVAVEKLSPGMFVGDVVTKPEVPPLIEAARRAGCATQTGTGMFLKVRDLMVDFLLEQESSPS